MQQTDILKRSERLSLLRGLFLLVLAVSVLGLGATMAGKHVGQTMLPSTQLVDLQILFKVTWLASLICIVAVNRRINKTAALKGLINDERARALRLRAFAIGFWVFLISTAAALVAVLIYDLDLKSTILAVLCIGGSTPALAQAFTSFDR